MSKNMTDAELAAHITESISVLNQLINGYAESPIEKIKKKAMLLGYWFKTYANYLRKESTFDYHALPNYKRGSIIQVDFGYRIGSELGGLHYAVVLNIPSSYNADTLTVVPLSSMHEGTRLSIYQLKLEDGVYNPLFQKANALYLQGKHMSEDAKAMIDSLDSSMDDESLKAVKSTIDAKARGATILLDSATQILDGISHLKTGSVARIGQITTISKIRIKRPIKKDDILYAARLSTQDMDAINQGVKNIYVF